MGPTRNSKSLNKRYSYVPDVSPSKDGDGSKRSNRRKRKLSDMLGPRWTVEELTRFYDSYRKNGKDWKKLASAVRNRSPEMVEALYTMNRAYLSLPHGTASATGLIAMMTDHYSNLAGSDSDQESNDEVRSSRKPQKRARCKVEPPTSKASDSQFLSPTLGSSYGCLSLLKKKRSGGSRPRPVGKRTPRFPISLPYDTMSEDKYFSPTRKGLQLNANADDDEVAHEIAIALAEASQRGGSPQVSGTPNKRAESVMSSPIRHSQRKNYLAEMANTKLLSADMDEEDLEGSTEADTGELFKYKSNAVESVSPGTTRQKGRKLKGKKFEIENNDDRHLDDTKEECSGTEEDQKSGVIRGKFDLEANNTNISRSPTQSQRKKSKKVLFGKDEEPAFDALQALADLSLMLPMENEDESRVLFKEEPDDLVDESVPLESQPANQPREKRKSTGVKMKGHLSSFGAASSKRSKPGKSSALDAFSVPEENQDSIQSNTNKVRRKQKVQVSKVRSNILSFLLFIIIMNMMVAYLNVCVCVCVLRSRRKMNLKKPVQEESKLLGKIDLSNLPLGSLHDTMLKSKVWFSFASKYLKFDNTNIDFQFSSCVTQEMLSNCLLNQRLRRWCTYEWFYSAIDYPWFSKREFVEYLYHVGLGHVPTLTHVEWGVIRSSLGKPRRFSEQFLKEEKEKLNQYRDSVRRHYTELREGIRDGLPTDLARPLSVGQRVIAIHPKTRDINDGSVLTVDHYKCRVQFDRPELGVEFVK
ncbi:Protein ALWAYS EARLY 3, partial [Striga hermonthica]